jgi:hypothetical protein
MVAAAKRDWRADEFGDLQEHIKIPYAQTGKILVNEERVFLESI